jgi:hypothetical protein
VNVLLYSRCSRDIRATYTIPPVFHRRGASVVGVVRFLIGCGRLFVFCLTSARDYALTRVSSSVSITTQHPSSAISHPLHSTLDTYPADILSEFNIVFCTATPVPT